MQMGGRLRHPEGTSVSPGEGETEQPTEADEACEPGVQTSGTWHRVSSRSEPRPTGPGNIR